jgi:hypothetical protein
MSIRASSGLVEAHYPVCALLDHLVTRRCGGPNARSRRELKFEVVNGALVWCYDPACSDAWSKAHAGKPTSKRFSLDERSLSSATILKTLETRNAPTRAR